MANFNGKKSNSPDKLNKPENFGDTKGFEAYRNAHRNSDVDIDRGSLHHTLGLGATQAAPGNVVEDLLLRITDLEKLNTKITDLEKLKFAVTLVATEDTVVTSTSNKNVSGLGYVLNVTDTNSVYEVYAGLDVVVSTGINIVELQVTDIPYDTQIITGGNGNRIAGSKKWLLTNLTPGNRAIKLVTRNSASSTNVTIKADHSIMVIKRIA